MDYADRVDALDRTIAEDRLVRRVWREQRDGREVACLLAALAPEVTDSARQCPAEVCPRWWAELTVLIDDRGSLAEWPAVVRRYAALARQWHALTPDAWARARHACLAVIVREARQWAGGDAVRAACDVVIALCDRAATGAVVSRAEWRGARAAAEAASVASVADVDAAEAAAASAEAAAASAEAEADDDASAAEAAEAAADASAADAAAADRMIAGWLVALEVECGRAGS